MEVAGDVAILSTKGLLAGALVVEPNQLPRVKGGFVGVAVGLPRRGCYILSY